MFRDFEVDIPARWCARDRPVPFTGREKSNITGFSFKTTVFPAFPVSALQYKTDHGMFMIMKVLKTIAGGIIGDRRDQAVKGRRLIYPA